MNGLDLDKIKSRIVEKFKKAVDEELVAVILAGSLSQNSYKERWSDIDLLIVIDNLNFDTKRKVAEAVTALENNSGIHHGINIISKEEFLSPILPEILLEGKTLQALIDFKKYPEKLIYSSESFDINKVYSPDSDTLKKYSLSNIGMFLRRNRRTLVARLYGNKNIKDLLKREMRASLIITKLAVQYFTAMPQEGHQEVLDQAKLLFPDFNFEVINDNFRIIERWNELNNENEILNIFQEVDGYIEKFTHYVFEKSQNK